MIKRASTILLTLFLLLTSASVFGVPMTSSTTFQKKDDVTGNFYGLSDIKITPPFIERIKTSYEKTNSKMDVDQKRSKYTVSSDGVYFGYKGSGSDNQPKVTFISIPFNNLTAGKKYKFIIKMKLDANGTGDGMKFNVGISGLSQTSFSGTPNVNSEEGGKRIQITEYNKSFTITYEFNATSSSGSYSLGWEWADKDKIKGLLISSISIEGDLEPTVISENGYEICKGEENVYTAVGISEPLTWEYSTDNKATWKKLTDKTGNSVTADLQDDFFYVRASNGTNKVESNKIQTFICCSKTSANKDKHIVVYEEHFNLTNGQRRPLDNNARSQYDYSSSGKIGGNESTSGKEAEYAIVHKASDGGYWKSEPVRQGNTVEKPGESDSNDGFLLVNCGKEKQDFFYYLVKQGNLCAESLYDFSVDITNVDNTAGQAPVNASILVYGQKNGTLSSTPLLEIETGNLESGHDWETFTRSFNSGGYKEFRISVRNNYQGTESDVKGNDIGIDNIVFRTCAPEIQIFAPKEDGSLEYEEVVLECNRKIKLEAIATYDLTEFFSTPQYLFQISTDKVNWTNVGSVQTTPSVEITVDDTYLNGFYYQVWVGADAAEVLKSGRTQTQGTGCGALTAVSDPINVKYECTNSSLPPTLKDFSSCALEDGKYDLYNTITKINLSDGTSEDVSNLDLAAKKAKIATLGKIEWYKEGETTPLPSSIIDFPTSPDNPGKYYAKFTQLSTTTIYTISNKSNVASISLLETITFDVTPLAGYKGCISEIENEHSFEIENIKPTESTTGDYKFTWMSVNEDGSLNEANPLQKGGTTYELPLVSGKGKIVVKAVSNSDAACPGISDPVEYDLAADPKFEYVGVNIPCKDQLKEDGVVINLKDISGSTQLKIKRTATDENNKVSETIFTSFDKTDAFKVINLNNGDTEYAFKDTYFDAQYFSADFDANKIAFVQYDIVLGIETTECKVEYSTETFRISSTNIFSLIPSINVVNISKNDNIVDFHVCEGELVTVESNYNTPSGLKAGEIYKWYVNDVLVEGDEAANSKSYTIDKIEATTIIKVELDKDPKVADAKTCGGSATITINVDEMPKIKSNDVYICEDDADGIQLSVTGGEKYKWSPGTGLSATDISNPIAKVSKTTTYTVDVYKGQCKNDTTVVVNVNNLPEITSIEPVSEEEKGNMVVTIVKEVGDTYSYSLDGENYAELPLDNIIKDLPIGWSLLYIKNDTTTCVNSKEFYIAPIEIKPDKFFSPNGDGNNDKWEVEHLNSYDSYIVEIFDRHSKRLFIQRVGSFNIGGTNTVDGDEFEGWNGEYNGKPMPSDDYWYLITVEDIRKQYTGHFTLKR